MALSPGTRLGPYEILAAIGAGGMGEVYKARDSRLGRDVAVKVLPPQFAADSDRVRRFEVEAHAASRLNHPNILTIFDIGTEGGTLYLVSELLDGETLRVRLESSALPARKAIDCAAQMAQAIAAAHERGIVHRDLKPENIFLTRDGRIKVLDFGLAKLRDGEATAPGDNAPTVVSNTGAGIVVGTVGYMSPEQVRGQPADARSDIFALGAVLYEMVTGRRAFERDSPAETMTAIVRDEPPPLAQAGVATPPALAAVVDHCLEKNPDERFQSARDLAFNLRALSDGSAAASGSDDAATVVPRARRRRLAAVVLALLAFAAGVATALLVLRWPDATAPIWFDKITFREGNITGARFAADGRSIVYSGQWSGAPEHVFVTQPGSAEFRQLDLPPARLLSVSKRGELALMLNPQSRGAYVHSGTLARVPATGGAPRELLENVEAADWGPDGESLAIVRTVDGRSRVEFPIGASLFETAGWIDGVRVAPGGDGVAFLHHPARGTGSGGGDVMLVDKSRHVKTLAAGWANLAGLAWQGDDLLFAASRTGVTKRLYAVSSTGAPHLLASGTGSLIAYDVAPAGQVLVARTSERIGLAIRTPADRQEREMSWLDWSLLRDMSSDGNVVAFEETGEGGAAQGGVYLRHSDGSPAVRLGDGWWPMLSRDRNWVACIQGRPPAVVVVPTGAGESQRIPTPGVTPLSALWFPDGRRLLVGGNETGHGVRYYAVPLDGGSPRPVTPDGSAPLTRVLSPDGQFVLTAGPDGEYELFPVEGGTARPVKGLGPNDLPMTMPSSHTVYAYDRIALPTPVSLIDLNTGSRTAVTTVGATRPFEAGRAFFVRVSDDARTYAYSYYQTTSELFLIRRGEQ